MSECSQCARDSMQYHITEVDGKDYCDDCLPPHKEFRVTVSGSVLISAASAHDAEVQFWDDLRSWMDGNGITVEAAEAVEMQSEVQK